MKSQLTEQTSINVRCHKCHRKNELISECCVVTQQTINLICCHSCIQVLKKQQKVNVEQVSDIFSECQQIKAFLQQNNLVELASNSIFSKTLDIADPLKKLLQNSKEFQNTSSITEEDFKKYCQERGLYKQLIDDPMLKQQIEKESKKLQSIIKQYFYDENVTPVFFSTIPKNKYQILHYQVLSYYFIILKYQTESEYLSTLNKKELDKKIKQEGYNPTIYLLIYDLRNNTNIYEDVLVEDQDLEYLIEDLINIYLIEQSNLIYVQLDDDYYLINLNAKQHPIKINQSRFSVIGDNLISIKSNVLLKFDPIDYKIIQKQEIFTRNWPHDQFLITYDKKINSFVKYHQPLRNQNEIIEVIQLNTLKCTKRIIFANYDRYYYNSIYYHNSFNYTFRSKMIVLVRQSNERKAFLIFLNLVTNKIIRKIPLSFQGTLQKIYLLKKQSILCLKYQNNRVELKQISTGKNIIEMEQFELYPIMQDAQIAIRMTQDEIKIFNLAQ